MIGTTLGSHGAGRARTLIAVIGIAVSLAACGDDDITGPVVGVTAVRDESFNFSSMHTFAMPDTVVQFAALTGSSFPPSREFDHVALDRVRQNLLQRGYTEVTNPRTTRPDFVVLVSSTATTNFDVYATYNWYSAWGFYSGWGWYAPGFTSSWTLVYPWYPTVGVTAYDRGTIVVTFLPTLSVNPLARNVTASWAGVASALLNGTVSSSTVQGAIDQMFALSPYLVASP